MNKDTSIKFLEDACGVCADCGKILKHERAVVVPSTEDRRKEELVCMDCF